MFPRYLSIHTRKKVWPEPLSIASRTLPPGGSREGTSSKCLVSNCAQLLTSAKAIDDGLSGADSLFNNQLSNCPSSMQSMYTRHSLPKRILLFQRETRTTWDVFLQPYRLRPASAVLLAVVSIASLQLTSTLQRLSLTKVYRRSQKARRHMVI